MDNQHRMINGYRELSKPQIDLINKIKDHGKATAELLREVGEHITSQAHDIEHARNFVRLGHVPLTWAAGLQIDPNDGRMFVNHDGVQHIRLSQRELADLSESIERQANAMMGANPAKWIDMGQTYLQTGLMFVTRGVAQPGFF